tara:strand:- start:1572 stop:2429 length:858 start_codon:yes stop_codon:yes gene_type:complete
MKKINFVKMHGLGNDFVIIDGRNQSLELTENIINKISDRKTGAGCDQIIVIEKSKINEVDGKIIIYNANGDQAEACGNGTRCVAKIFFDELKKNQIQLESASGILKSNLNENGLISVNMGKIRSKWSDIPLSQEVNTLDVPISYSIPSWDEEGVHFYTYGYAVAVNVGNPHLVLFGKNIIKCDLLNLGNQIENHQLFPEKTNVEVVEIIDHNTLKMRVWERGVGETLACGSGSCAAVYAGYKLSLNSKDCEVVLEKGSLFVKINENNEAVLTGPAETSFYGSINY